MITIHGRTRCQFYKGEADWLAIADVSQAVDIPVIANGDITNGQTARTAMQAAQSAGVMIGRGAQGRPWLLAQVAAALEGRAPATAPPVREALHDMVCGHYEAMLGFYGVDLGLRVARKHLGWYMQAAGTAAAVRRAILTSASPSQVTGLLRRAFTTNLEAVA